MIRVLDLFRLFQFRDFQFSESQKPLNVYLNTKTPSIYERQPANKTVKEHFAKKWFALKGQQLEDFPDLSISSHGNGPPNILCNYDVVVYGDRCIQAAEYDIPVKIYIKMEYVEMTTQSGDVLKVPKVTIDGETTIFDESNIPDDLKEKYPKPYERCRYGSQMETALEVRLIRRELLKHIIRNTSQITRVKLAN